MIAVGLGEETSAPRGNNAAKVLKNYHIKTSFPSMNPLSDNLPY